MEKKSKIRNKRGNQKNNLVQLLKEYKKFYQKNLKFKHIVITIIMILFFFIMFNYALTRLEGLNETAKESIVVSKSFFSALIKEKIPFSGLVIFAGITPFVFLSVLGILYAYTLALELATIYFVNQSIVGMVIGCLGAIIQILGMAISVATGIYYCLQSSKKFRYNQHQGFGLKDVKKYYYEMRKDEKKKENFEQKEYQKMLEKEKLNVKIPYIHFIISFCMSAILIILGTILVALMK